MCEVVKTNFKELFPDIAKSIRNCDFIAIDTEFTGLLVDGSIKNSLFDDGAARYTKLRKTIQQITVTQFGLSLFKKDKEENRYEAESYNIYLFPKSFGPVDKRFLCQASSLEFISQYNFDFNKFIYEGVSYMNNEEEAALLQHLESKAMFTGLERNIDEDSLQKVCSNVAEWFIGSKHGDVLTIDKDNQEKIPRYILSMELQSRFPEVWTCINKTEKTITVQRVSLTERQQLEQSTEDKFKTDQQQLIEDMMGFTRIFRLMTEVKKPVIVHNGLMDMMLLYEKFHRPLPSVYTQFKSDLHNLLPKIVDTKHVANKLRRTFRGHYLWQIMSMKTIRAEPNQSMEEKAVLQNTALGAVYNDFNSDKGRDVVIHSPDVIHAPNSTQYAGAEMPHEAGFDAFMCGFVFLKLAHVITFKDTKSSAVQPCTFSRYLYEMQSYMNRLNIPRASIHEMNIGGADSQAARLQLLYVQARLTKRLNVHQLAKWFSAYGSVDVQMWNQSKALVATSNFNCAKQILCAFKNHQQIRVARYSMWKHSPVIRGILWSSVLISGSLCAWAILSKNKKS